MRWFICLILFLSLASGQVPIPVGQFAKKPSAAGGPMAWYDIETSANADTDDSGPWSRLNWSAVTVGQGGSATKIRVYIHDRTGACDVKAALYDNSGNLISGASGTASTVGAAQYLEITLGTPATVTATTYKIAWMYSTALATAWYKAGSGSFDFNSSELYANQPVATLPSSSGPLTRGYAVSLYVE